MTQEIRIGDESRPVDAKAPWVLADALVQRVWDGGGLLYRVGEWWAWVGGKWRLKSEEEMGLHVMRELAQMWVRVTRGEEEVVVPVGPNKGMCEEVLWALRAQREVKVLGHPVWLTGQGDKPRAEDCVAFEDVVVAVKGEGVEVVGVRGPEWFGPVVPCEWEEGAECPVWMGALAKWSKGDEGWVKVLQRFMGMVLTGRRDSRKLLALLGKTGGGKGVLTGVFSGLMGEEWFRSVDCDTLVSPFGLAGLGRTSLMVVTEMQDLGRVQKETFGRVVKQVLGQDKVSTQEKYQAIQHNTVVKCAMVVCGNQIPRIGNQGQGVSNKILVLPIKNSFDVEGGMDKKLPEKLRGEVKGIAAWAMKGAVEYCGGGEEMWPRVEGAEEMMREFGLANNPMDEFLEDVFVRNERGFVDGETLKREWREWVKEAKRPWAKEVRVKGLLAAVEKGGTWHLEQARWGGQGVRGLKGLSLRKCKEGE